MSLPKWSSRLHATNVYDRFHTVNLHDALRDTPEGLYQVITALDVFIYAATLTAAISQRVPGAGN